MATNWAQVFRQNQYEDARREKNALEVMELGLKMEERDRQRARQEESDAMQKAKFEGYETSQAVLNIESQFKPFTATLADPANVSFDDLDSIKESLSLLSSDSRLYDKGSIERSAIDTQISFVNNLVENTENYLNANQEFDQVRENINKSLISIDKNTGAYNIRDTADIVNNAQSLLTSKYAEQNQSFAAAVNALAKESKRYKDNPDAIGNQKEMVELAKRAAAEEDINLAYNILAKVPEDVQRADATMATSAQLKAEADRKFVVSRTKILEKSSKASVGEKNLDVLQTFGAAISDTEGNFQQNPDRWQTVQMLFNDVVQNAKERDKGFKFSGKWGGGSVFENLPSIGGGRMDLPNNLEAMAGIMVGWIMQSPDDANVLTWADGREYARANKNGTLEIINPIGEYDFNEIAYASEITQNLNNLDYGGGGTKQGKVRTHRSAAQVYLRLNPDINSRTKEISGEMSGDTNLEIIDNEEIDKKLEDVNKNTTSGEVEQIDKKPSSSEFIANSNSLDKSMLSKSKSKTRSKKGGTEIDYNDSLNPSPLDLVKKVGKAMSKGQEKTKLLRAQSQLARLKNRLTNAEPSKVARIKQQILKQEKLVSKYRNEKLASR